MKRFDLTPSEKRQKIDQHIHADFPVVIGVVILKGICNLRCRMCPMCNVRFDRPEFMSRETFDRLLDLVPDTGRTHVELTAMGEPLLHTERRYFLRRLGERYCKNSTLLVTTGHGLDDEMAELILDARIDRLQVSLNAHGAENYRWFTGSPDYERVVRNLENLLSKKRERGTSLPYITTHIAGIREFEPDFEPVLSQWKGKVELPRIREVKDWSGITTENGIHPLLSEEISCERYPCSWLWESMEVYPSGEVYTCSFHPFFKTPSLGSIHSGRVEEIWQSEILRDLRQRHLSGLAGEVDFCATCTNWYLYPNFWDRPGESKGFPGTRWELPTLSGAAA
jgi:radical SAM protein with 4Fe4S-binding SPASM domain